MYVTNDKSFADELLTLYLPVYCCQPWCDCPWIANHCSPQLNSDKYSLTMFPLGQIGRVTLEQDLMAMEVQKGSTEISRCLQLRTGKRKRELVRKKKNRCFLPTLSWLNTVSWGKFHFISDIESLNQNITSNVLMRIFIRDLKPLLLSDSNVGL